MNPKSSSNSVSSGLHPLAEEYNLYLKPIARINLTVQLPVLHDASGSVKSVTIWEIIEKLRRLCPGVLSPPTVIRVARTTLEFVRLVADVESKADVKRAVTSLDSQYIKLSGFPQNLSVRACEAPADCPRRHDWESFFREAKDMDETIPGQRPDTVILSGLPIRWFVQSVEDSASAADSDKPSLAVTKAVFEHFGSIRYVDIPMLDPVQNPDISDSYFDELDGIHDSTTSPLRPRVSTNSPTQAADEQVGGFGKIGPGTIFAMNHTSCPPADQCRETDKVTGKPYRPNGLAPLTFTAYVQYMDYTGFLRAMTALHGQKLVYVSHKSDGPTDEAKKLYFTAELKVDFDREKHLSESSIVARKNERDRLALIARRRREEAIAAAAEKRRQLQLIEDAHRKEEERRQAEELAMEAVKQAKKAARAERKRQRAIERCRTEKNELLKEKIRLEELRRLHAVRKVESIRLMTFLLTRIQNRHDALVARKRALRSTTHSDPPINVEVNPEASKRLSDSAQSPVEESKTLDSQSPDVILQQILRRREQKLRELLLKKRQHPGNSVGRT